MLELLNYLMIEAFTVVYKYDIISNKLINLTYTYMHVHELAFSDVTSLI